MSKADYYLDFENEYCIGVPSLNKNPKTLIGSYVIIPKSHVKSPFDLSVEEWLATKDLMDRIKSNIDENTSLTVIILDGMSERWPVRKWNMPTCT